MTDFPFTKTFENKFCLNKIKRHTRSNKTSNTKKIFFMCHSKTSEVITSLTIKSYPAMKLLVVITLSLRKMRFH